MIRQSGDGPPCPQGYHHGRTWSWQGDRWYCPSTLHIGYAFYAYDGNGTLSPAPRPALSGSSRGLSSLSADRAAESRPLTRRGSTPSTAPRRGSSVEGGTTT